MFCMQFLTLWWFLLHWISLPGYMFNLLLKCTSLILHWTHCSYHFVLFICLVPVPCLTMCVFSPLFCRFASEPNLTCYANIAIQLQNKTIRDVALRVKWMNVSHVFFVNGLCNCESHKILLTLRWLIVIPC